MHSYRLNRSLLRTSPWLLAALALALIPSMLFAQEPAPAPLVTTGDGTRSLTDIILDLAVRYPIISSLLLVIGALRFVVKPLLLAARYIVRGTASTKDDEWLTRIEGSPWLTAILFAADWLASIKLPKPSAPPGKLSVLFLLCLVSVALTGCASTKTVMTDPATGQVVQISDWRFLIKSSGKNNSALREADGSFVVEWKSAQEGGDTQMVGAIAAGVIAGMQAAKP